ncbi:MAG: GntR family transcriptional regulator [Thermodesulfobacteriota bacterium]
MKNNQTKEPAFQTEGKRISKLLRKEIYSGQRLPYEHLTEKKLAETFGSNRMIIREVLSELAGDGLVSIEPYKGASVAAVSVDQIFETFQVVAMLEGFSAKQAAMQITEEDLNFLRINLEQQKKIKAGDTHKWQALNYQFHRLINVKSGNGKIIHLIRRYSQFTNYWFLSMSSGEFKPAVKAHEKILKALAEGNGDKARKYMEEHITFRVKRLVDSIKDSIPIGMFRSL